MPNVSVPQQFRLLPTFPLAVAMLVDEVVAHAALAGPGSVVFFVFLLRLLGVLVFANSGNILACAFYTVGGAINAVDCI